ncbi:MAG TPA: FAD-binding protein [bacterium]
MEAEVIVIGCGPAGFSAALGASANGKDVTVISNPASAAGFFSGAVFAPGHPYKAMDLFVDALHDGGYTFKFHRNETKQILAENGGAIETGIYSEMSGVSETSNLFKKRVLFIGFENLREYIPELICSRFREKYPELTAGWGVRRIKLESIVRDAWISKITLARLLEEKEYRARFIETILRLNDIMDYDAVIFPAVLGIDSSAEIFRELQKGLKPEIGELLSVIPSVNGIRLLRAIRMALKKRGINFIPSMGAGFTLSGRLITGIKIAGDTKEIMNAGKIIYAPGRFIGGGIKSGRQFVEPLFGLPIFNGKRALTGYEVLYNDSYWDEHAGFRVGVKVDELLRPLNEYGEVFLENLFAAGSIIQQFSGVGMSGSVYSGYSASQDAA